ncbi:CopD family protein [Sphingomonas sp. TREG-RG-20F-R18-01]|uniref:CopD family protein n=1 Tax=Sphingomonas sp. TREG-RG-20F-R18-01 TaxID=2914982 RepID=UPI001F56AC40|nr:CopD family protein [Sphingomonas sp. TREG-RG-20F-R18-01]
MIPGTAYLWLKAIHVAAALTFVGGVLAVSVLLAALPADPAIAAPFARGVRRWDRAVTTPAMLLVWTLGLILATSGHWFTETWLQVKFAFVLLLSGLHGVQSGRLRRLATGSAVRPLRTAPIVLACLLVIALMAVAKPF